MNSTKPFVDYSFETFFNGIQPLLFRFFISNSMKTQRIFVETTLIFQNFVSVHYTNRLTDLFHCK